MPPCRCDLDHLHGRNEYCPAHDRRPDRWWMRWYVVRSVAATSAGGIALDAVEYVECGTATRFGARRLCAAVGDPGLRPVRRTVWLADR